MFQVLQSAAGAGKTHALVKYYLGHCLRGEDPAAYRQVLALTFTNKAAAEMKQRVLDYLDELAAQRSGDARIADLVTYLAPSGSAEEIALRARRTLHHMLHHWDDVAISTIDAFTQKVVRPFARDLQLDHDLRMTTEQDHYLQRAVDAVIAEAGVDPKLTRSLSEACLQLLIDERRWEPGIPLRELSGELVKESAIAPLRALADLNADEVQALAVRLRAQDVDFRARVNAIGDEAMRLLERHGLSVDDMAHGKGGIFGYFQRARHFMDVWDPPGTNALKPFESGKWWSGKATEAAIASLQAISGELTALFHRAEELRTTGLHGHVVRRAVARELLPAFVLHEMDLRLHAIKRADRVAFFSDLTRKVAAVVRDEPVPFIYERMGERYRHFLIDEFQDTSLLQWQALLPLVDNALSTGGTVLLVGDAKQAIYRWRNGEVRLFTRLPRIFANGPTQADADRERTLLRTHVPIEPLAYNRRSAGDIVAFNNALFDPLQQLLDDDLRKVYTGHHQQVARKEAGLVRLAVLPAEVKGIEKRDAVLDFTLASVREALADGFAPGDVAVLVRGRSLGGPVAAHLVAHGHRVVSPDGLVLGGDSAVELLIDLLRFIASGDPAAASRVVQYRAMLAAPADARHVTIGPSTGGADDPIAYLRDRLRDRGQLRPRTTLTALIAELAHDHGLLPATDATILALLDEVHAWTNEHGQDIPGFIGHWERKGHKRSISPPDDGSAVQVMTVHKSKGLQFPVVIVPNINMTTSGNFGERFWIDPGAAVPELPVALVREGKALRAVGTAELDEEGALRILDAMNLLYVAFTRPEQRLYALAPGDRADAITKAVIGFAQEQGDGEGMLRGERGRPWHTGSSTGSVHLSGTAVGSRPEPILRMEAPADWDPADPDPFRSHGETVHAIMARIVHIGDLAPAVQEAVAAGALTASAGAALEQKLSDLLRLPEVAPWFAPDGVVRSEATLVTPDGHTLRPDRVITREGRIGVLDIKTGSPRPGHREQVRNYMRHVADMGPTAVDGALLYLREGAIEHVTLQ